MKCGKVTKSTMNGRKWAIKLIACEAFEPLVKDWGDFDGYAWSLLLSKHERFHKYVDDWGKLDIDDWKRIQENSPTLLRFTPTQLKGG